MKRRNPNLRSSRYNTYRGPRGAKLEEVEEDLSPEISPIKIPKSEMPPPLQSPDLGKSVKPQPLRLPIPDDPFWKESRLRRLPHYFYRHLPATLSGGSPESAVSIISEGKTPKSDPSAVGVVTVGNSDVAPLEHRSSQTQRSRSEML